MNDLFTNIFIPIVLHEQGGGSNETASSQNL